MGKVSHGLIFAAVMIITVALVDVLFFRHHTGQRLVVNVGIVLVYLAFYWRFFKRT
jgi:hypothetical protein